MTQGGIHKTNDISLILQHIRRLTQKNKTYQDVELSNEEGDQLFFRINDTTISEGNKSLYLDSTVLIHDHKSNKNIVYTLPMNHDGPIRFFAVDAEQTFENFRSDFLNGNIKSGGAFGLDWNKNGAIDSPATAFFAAVPILGILFDKADFVTENTEASIKNWHRMDFDEEAGKTIADGAKTYTQVQDSIIATTRRLLGAETMLSILPMDVRSYVVQNMAMVSLECVREKNAKSAQNNSGETLLVEFTAGWCFPCKVLAPVLDKAAPEFQKRNVEFVQVDIDESKVDLAEFGCTGVPCTAIFQNGKFLKSFKGNSQKVTATQTSTGANIIEFLESITTSN